MRPGPAATVAAALLGPALLAVGALLPTQSAARPAPTGAAAQLAPCPKLKLATKHKPAKHEPAVGTTETLSVSIPAIPGVNCR
jgi:hypothetical protein